MPVFSTPPSPSPKPPARAVEPQKPRRIEADEAGQRVDRYLRRAFPFVPHSLVHKWLRSGQVRLNGARVKADARLAEDDLLRLPPQSTAESVRSSSVSTFEEVRTSKRVRTFDKKTLSLLRKRILLEREDFFLLDKPAGLACQGGSGIAHALDRQLLALAESRPSLGVPRLVHRLDRATSGLLLVAKSRRSAADLARLFREGKVRKTYCAILAGTLQNDTKKDNTKNITSYRSPLADKRKGEQEATTHLFTLAQNEELDRALVLLRPLSGRKHQLRRHMAEAGMPVLGDRLYATRRQSEGLQAEPVEAEPVQDKPVQAKSVQDKPARLMLHALRLVITKEDSQESERGRAHDALDVHLPPPEDFLAACSSLRLDAQGLKDSLLDPFPFVC